jgi:hypothetical protein
MLTNFRRSGPWGVNSASDLGTVNAWPCNQVANVQLGGAVIPRYKARRLRGSGLQECLLDPGVLFKRVGGMPEQKDQPIPQPELSHVPPKLPAHLTEQPRQRRQIGLK